MTFLEGLSRANRSTVRAFGKGETVLINNIRVIAAVDDLSQTSFARSGGVTKDVESAIFVDEADFAKAGGRKGSIVRFPKDGNKTSIIQRISDFQGVLYLALAPFKP